MCVSNQFKDQFKDVCCWNKNVCRNELNFRVHSTLPPQSARREHVRAERRARRRDQLLHADHVLHWTLRARRQAARKQQVKLTIFTVPDTIIFSQPHFLNFHHSSKLQQ